MKRPWLDEVRQQLARRKLPPAYIERLIEELSDHFHDFQKEKAMSMDARPLVDDSARLGDPSEVAQAAATEYRRAKFSRRHPVITFAVFPPLLVFGLWLGFIAVFAAALYLLDWLLNFEQLRIAPAAFLWVLSCVMWAGLVLSVVLSTYYFCRTALASTQGLRWAMLASLLIAVLGSTFVVNSSQGSTMVSLRLPPTQFLQFVQFLTPLALGGIMIWHLHKKPRAAH